MKETVNTGFKKLSAIFTDNQETQISKLDWFLITSDREIDKIHAEFRRIVAIDSEKSKLHNDYAEIINFKINQAYHLLMSLEENIYLSAFDFYKEHFGIFRNQNQLTEMKKLTISYLFENFATQLKTLVDLFLKYLGELHINTICKLGSFEDISRKVECIGKARKNNEYNNAKRDIGLLKKEKSLRHIFKTYDSIYNLKNYRDFIVHRGKITQDISYSSLTSRYLECYYGLPEIKIQISGNDKQYTIDDKHTYRLEFFCRVRFLECIVTISRTLNELIDPQKIDTQKKELLAYQKENLKSVLEFFANKVMWNHKTFMNIEDFKKYLNEHNVKFNDLVIEKQFSHREFEGHTSFEGKDMSYLLERTIYHPMGYLQFQRVKKIYDRDWQPKSNHDVYGIIKSSFTAEDLHKPSEETKKIFETLTKLGILIKMPIETTEAYVFVDEELLGYIVSLIGLTRAKWMSYEYAQMQYLRKPTRKEKNALRRLWGEESIKEIEKSSEEQQQSYRAFKTRMRAWNQFKREHHLNVRNFRKNNTNYQTISRTWDSGLFNEIREHWSVEYSNEGMLEIRNKEGTQVLDRLQLLDYLHELNTDFLGWKQRFGTKFPELQKTARNIFANKKKHFVELEKEFVNRGKKEYSKTLADEKTRLKATRKKYAYLTPILKTICEDFFTSQFKIE